MEEEKIERRRRATKAVTRLRVDDLLNLVLNDSEFPRVEAYIRQQEKIRGSIWAAKDDEPAEMSERTIRFYLARCERLIEKTLRPQRARLIAKHMARREFLYGEAVLNDDPRTALAVLESLAKLEGVYPTRDRHDAPTETRPQEPQTLEPQPQKGEKLHGDS